MLVDHRLLYRMQIAVVAKQSFDRDQFLAINSRKELDAGIYGLEFDIFAASINLDYDECAGTAIPLGTTLFRAFECEVFAQELQYSARWIDDVCLDDVAIEHETDGRCRHTVNYHGRLSKTMAMPAVARGNHRCH